MTVRYVDTGELATASGALEKLLDEHVAGEWQHAPCFIYGFFTRPHSRFAAALFPLGHR